MARSQSVSKISLTILYLSEEYEIQTFSGEYRDLKCLIQDRLFTDDFGQCGGMGRCGTCIVRIDGLKKASGFIRNEATTLNRLASGIDNVRLACQIPVDEGLSNMTIIVM